MKRFLIVILLTALLPDVSIWSLYLREVPLLVSILWFLPTTLLTAAWLALVFEFRHSLAARTLNGCILCFVVPKICFLLFQIITPWAGLLAAVTAELLAIYGLTLGWRRLKVRQVRICFPTLPAAFDGYRLLHLSDFHLGTFGRHNPFVRRVIETANQQEADLVVFTGDLVNKVAREPFPIATTWPCSRLPTASSPSWAITTIASMGRSDGRDTTTATSTSWDKSSATSDGRCSSTSTESSSAATIVSP